MDDFPEARLSEQAIEEALQGCAAEPVHIPGIVQNFACLIGVNSDSGQIDYASANCADILGSEANDLLGQSFRDVFGPEISHALNNASGSAGFRKRSTPLGTFEMDGRPLDVAATVSDGIFMVQFEPEQDPDLGGGDALTALSFLMREIQNCEGQQELLELSTELLRHLTSYDRVMVYRFDPEFNGHVIAEARQRTIEPFLGLHFPHWDIPTQARAIMARIPLRMIEDIDQTPVPLLAAHAALPPLDMTLAECRGVSPVHMEYLRNMGIFGTLTLTIMVDNALWGIISFHHRRPKVLPAKTRELLCAFQEIFCSKLTVLRKQAQLDLARRIDTLKDEALGSIAAADSTTELATAGPAILQAIQGDGLAVMTGSSVRRHGQIPDQSVLDHLSGIVHQQDAGTLRLESIAADYPELSSGLNGIAGALVVADGPGRTMFLFRKEIASTVSWAGNPDKTIDLSSGSARLRPRGSFSLFLEEVQGKCQSWTEDDLAIAARIWVLINSAERQELRNRLQTQQELMINELNHRVRNILSLVRSVSRQARRHNSSLESYSAAMEQRIQSLAAAHDLASGALRSSISILELIEIELEPYQKDDRITVTGTGPMLRADIAPIFSLVIHELATNATKYGSLSADDGTVTIQLKDVKGGIALAWRERGGPDVVPPKDRGFGSTLIEQAVPYEMGGTAELRFVSTGVEADIFLPSEILDLGPSRGPVAPRGRSLAPDDTQAPAFDPTRLTGLFLVVEDNYAIAKDLRDQLTAAGINDVEICSNVRDALDILGQETPVFAILDVNLGPDKTSEPLALRLLQEGVPFIFATGYGDKANLTSDLAHVQTLTKPLATGEVLEAIAALLDRPDR